MIIVGILAVWLVWQVLEQWVEANRGIWCLIAAVLGIGWQLLADWDEWWIGLGIGGGAVVLTLLADLLLVATDLVKVHVLRWTSNTR